MAIGALISSIFVNLVEWRWIVAMISSALAQLYEEDFVTSLKGISIR